jgi:hypothetical protein
MNKRCRRTSEGFEGYLPITTTPYTADHRPLCLSTPPAAGPTLPSAFTTPSANFSVART